MKQIPSLSELKDLWLAESHELDLLEKKIQDICLSYLSSDKVCLKIDDNSFIQSLAFSSIPEERRLASDVIEDIENITRHSTNISAKGFIGHMTGPLPNFIPALAKLITTINQNQVKQETAQSTTHLENLCLSQLHQLFYNNSTSFYQQQLKQSQPLGIVTSGGTLANITALQCARNNALAEFGSIEESGLFQVMLASGYRKQVIICSDLAHYSLKKSLGVLGLGRENLMLVKTDQNQQMNLAQLQKTIHQCRKNHWHIIAVVAVSGTTECGSFDDIAGISAITKKYNIHLHVDAAWGGAVIFSKTHRKLLKGIKQADSITIDAHKQLHSPIGLGMVLFRDPSITQNIKITANYIIREQSNDLGRYGIEGSRPAMVLYLYATLQILAQKGIAAILDQNIQLIQDLADYIKGDKDFELVTHPQSNILLYRYSPSEWQGRLSVEQLNLLNKDIHEAQKQKGHHLVSRTALIKEQEHTVCLRIVLNNPTVQLKDCINVLNEQRTIAQALLTDF